MSVHVATEHPDAPPHVHCHNGWDTLEEVIVGTMDGACVPPWDETLRATMPRRSWSFFQAKGGTSFSSAEIDAANENLDALAGILRQNGITVRRPESTNHCRSFETPDWSSKSGLYSAMPRDVALVVGETLIEAPMPWRSRYHEIAGYRPLFYEYFRTGANWINPPKPLLQSSLYRDDYGQDPDGHFRSILNETEIVFDAADFLPCGQEIYYFPSHVTNWLGIEWLERTLGEPYRLIELDCTDGHRMHIDTTFLPLGPGRMLVNPDRVTRKSDVLKNWEFLPAPAPCTPDGTPLYMSGKWLSMNILMIDPQSAVVAVHETNLIRSLEGWGITAIPCPFVDFYRFGGSIHCATLDVRRSGPLQSYL